jgi:hypothetical protein
MRRKMKKSSKLIIIIAAILLAGLVLIQLVPYGRDHSNPPVVSEPKWDSPQTRDLASKACFDCHSNETVWPWYANIAPASWLVQYDVDKGRERFNFSVWQDTPSGVAQEFTEVIGDGEMPPPQYLLLHPNARLSPTEKSQLISGLSASIK